MSLEVALAENTAALKELIAALTAAGALQTAQASAAAHSSPAVQAVVKAQKEANAKDATAKKPTATAADAEPAASGEPSASTGASSSDAPTLLHDWHEKTADKHAELKDAEPNLENVRKAILGINQLIGRAQADAVLARFGAQAVTEKKEGDKVIKRGLDEVQYADFLALCLRVLAGEVDATLSIAAE